MDIENLKELQIKAKGLSILVVEDSKLLQKQVKKFLDKFFENVYQAYDGEDGLTQYKESNPYIVLTDLSMPKMDGMSMIKEIKQIDNNARIIIFSAHNDEEVLMNVIKFNIIDFLMKPLDIDKFTDILLTILGSKKLNQYEQCLHDLEMIYTQKGQVRFVNYFQDFVIEQEGQIIDIVDGVFKIKIPHTQILAIDYERNIILELKSINKFMKLKLIEIDKEHDFIYLTQPIYIDYILNNITNKRYFYNKEFKIGLHKEHKYFNLDVLDISYDRVAMYSDENDIDLEISDGLNLTISLETEDIYSRGKIISVESYRKGIKIISDLDIKIEDRINFKNYLHSIEDNIIKELAQ